MKPQISQIVSRFRACYRTQDCQNIEKLGVGRCPTPRQGETPPAPAGTSATCRGVPLLEKTTETQGMGTVVRPEGTNGEVPRPLCSFGVFVENEENEP